jgi:serine/threonine protein kinase
MATITSPPPFPGDIVGSYTLIDTIGVGGNATVFKAHSNSAGDVAVKILHPGKTSEEDLRRFRREFLSLQALEHNNIVRVYENGIHNDYPWISMELIEGTDLDSLIRSWTYPIQDEQFSTIKGILQQMCQALEYIHSQGIIHRDLKPSNVLINQNGTPKLTDFGVVKNPQQFKSELTTMGSLVGTVAFMAPELIIGEDLDHRADLYSLGALLYMALTGKKPFEAKTIVGYLSQHLTQPPTRPSSENQNIPERLDNICFQLLQKNPNNRYSNAADVLQDINTITNTIVLIERKEQEGELQAALDIWKNNESLSVSIIGNSGAGKTAFLQRFIQNQPHQEILSLSPPSQDIDAWNVPTISQSIIICIDDIDNTSHAVKERIQNQLQEYIQQGINILLIYTTQKGSDFGLKYQERKEIILNGLTPKGTQTLLRSHHIAGAAAIVLAKRLCEAFCGLPGHILDTLNLLIENKWLTKDAKGKYRSLLSNHMLTSTALPTPTVLQQEIRTKLSPLSSTAKLMIECMAVYQMPATLPLIYEFLQFDPNTLAEPLKELQNHRWIERDDGQFIQLQNHFPNSAIYDILSEERRVIWHQRISSVLRSKGRRRVSELAEPIAHHLILSRQIESAIPFLLMSAQRKLRTQLFLDAENLLRSTQALIERPETKEIDSKNKYMLYHGLGKALFAQKKFEEAIQNWQEALEYVLYPEEKQIHDQIMVQIGLAQIQLNCLSLDIKQSVFDLPPDTTIRNQALKEIAFYRFAEGHIEEAEEAWIALGKSEKKSNQVISLSGKAMIQAAKGDNNGALLILEQHHSLLKDRWLLYAIELYLVSGWWEKATILSADLAERAKLYDDNLIRIKALSYHGLAMLWLGSPTHANHSFHEAGFNIGMMHFTNDLSPLIVYARLGAALNFENLSLVHNILQTGGKSAQERQYHHILCQIHNTQPHPRIPISFPWLDVLNRIDFLNAQFPHQPEECIADINLFWSEIPNNQFDGVKLLVSIMGYKWTKSNMWKLRAEEAIVNCFQKQPSRLQFQSYWLEQLQ